MICFLGVREDQLITLLSIIGDGNMIQAPTTSDVVKITALRYYMPNFARRVLSEAPGIVTEGNLEVANVD